MMKAQLFSIVAGSEACNARCPFCISKMTPPLGIELKEPEANWRNFTIAAMLARQSGATTAMITGKGEPTLFPNQITKYLETLQALEAPLRFPIVELQTNGIRLQERKDVYDAHLRKWYELGLSIIAVSIVHYDAEKNRQVYTPDKKEYISIPELASYLHGIGFSMRLSCIMADGFIDSAGGLERLIQFAQENSIEQLTVRPVNKPGSSRNAAVEKWVAERQLKDGRLAEIANYLATHGHALMSLPHGATVYDVNGQNVCLTNSLTIDKAGEDVRQLIFFPDGHLRYDWQHKGAILL